MKIIFTLAWAMIISCFVLLFTCDAANMQIHFTDGKYEVWTWDGDDGAMVKRIYTVAEAQGKFDKLFDPSVLKSGKVPSRVFIEYSDVDGLPLKIIAHETGVFKTVPASTESLAKTDATAIKDDIETKTGKGIDGGTIKKPVEGDGEVIENP